MALTRGILLTLMCFLQLSRNFRFMSSFISKFKIIAVKENAAKNWQTHNSSETDTTRATTYRLLKRHTKDDIQAQVWVSDDCFVWFFRGFSSLYFTYSGMAMFAQHSIGKSKSGKKQKALHLHALLTNTLATYGLTRKQQAIMTHTNWQPDEIKSPFGHRMVTKIPLFLKILGAWLLWKLNFWWPRSLSTVDFGKAFETNSCHYLVARHYLCRVICTWQQDHLVSRAVLLRVPCGT